MSVQLQGVIPCSQMDNPQAGTGTGGDRCTEACASMIDCTYRLGPLAKTIDTGANPQDVAEQVMYQLTQMLNNGSNVSHLEDFGVWVPEWLSSNGYDKTVTLNNVHNPGWNDIMADINRGHMAVIGVNDYTQLHLVGGGDPYQWPENAANAGGHVLMLIGYDPANQNIVVIDPLRGFSGDPAVYTFASLQAAGFSDLTEVVGPALQITGLASSHALCVDVSSWQGNIDWPTYHTWAQQQSADGRSHVIMRASQDVKTKDADFEQNWSGAVAAGIDEIVVYHYAYPQDDTPQAEADWFVSVVGSRLRPQDTLMLDFEEDVPEATDAWVLAFRDEVKKLTGREVVAYENLNMVQTHMHDPALSSIPLVLADWTFDPNNIPTTPPAPFTQLLFVQFTDKGSVPGISGAVDMDVFLGGSSMPGVPSGWSDDGTKLIAPNGHYFVLGFRDLVRAADWDPEDVPLEEEHPVDKMEMVGPNAIPGTEQITEKNVLMYNEGKNNGQPFTMWVGQELFHTRAALDAANTQIATDQATIAALNKQIADLNTRIDGLNHDVAAEQAAVQQADNQLAAEVSRVNDLETQIKQLEASGPTLDPSIKPALTDLSAGLKYIPTAQQVVDSVLSKLP